MIAASIFSVVIGVALQQFSDTVQVSNYSTVQADLRRVGQDVLARIVQDLRSTQSQYVGVNQSSTWGKDYIGDTLELARVVDYNASSQSVVLEGSTTSTPVTYIRYTSMSPTAFTSANMTPDGRYQILTLWKGNSTFLAGSTQTSELTRELAPNGFQIKAATRLQYGTTGTAWTDLNNSNAWVQNPFIPTASSLSKQDPVNIKGTALPGGSYASDNTKHFSNIPTLLAIRLQLRRRTGFGAGGDIYTTVNMQTEVLLRADSSF